MGDDDSVYDVLKGCFFDLFIECLLSVVFWVLGLLKFRKCGLCFRGVYRLLWFINL